MMEETERREGGSGGGNGWMGCDGASDGAGVCDGMYAVHWPSRCDDVIRRAAVSIKWKVAGCRPERTMMGAPTPSIPPSVHEQIVGC